MGLNTASPYYWRLCLLWTALALLLGPAAVYGQDTARKSFNLPEDSAERSLKKFSEQSGLEIMFATSVVANVRTRRVVGAMSSAEALRALLEGTPLRAVTDARTGTIAIRREDAAGKEKRRETPAPVERPNG